MAGPVRVGMRKQMWQRRLLATPAGKPHGRWTAGWQIRPYSAGRQLQPNGLCRGDFPDTGQHGGRAGRALAARRLQRQASTTSKHDSAAGWAASTPYGGRSESGRFFPDKRRARRPHVHANGQEGWESTGSGLGTSRGGCQTRDPGTGEAFLLPHPGHLVVPPTPGKRAFRLGQFSPYHNKIDFLKAVRRHTWPRFGRPCFRLPGVPLDFIQADGVTSRAHTKQMT